MRVIERSEFRDENGKITLQNRVSGGPFRPARPNLQQSALSAADLLLNYFHSLGYDLPQVDPVLMFINPRAHVDTVHPRARIVLADALEHFAANLREQPPIMDREDGQLLIEALLHPPQPKVEEVLAPPPPRPLPPPRRRPPSAPVPCRRRRRRRTSPSLRAKPRGPPVTTNRPTAI